MQVWITILAGPILLFGERFPSPLVLLALAAILHPWVARLISRGHLSRPTPLDLPVLAMFLMVPLGLYASVDLELSLPLVGQLLVGASLFYGLANATKPKVHPGWLAFLFVFGTAGLTLAVLIVSVLGGWGLQGLLKPQGGVVTLPLGEQLNLNVLAGLAAMALPLALRPGSRQPLGVRGPFLLSKQAVTRIFLAVAIALMLTLMIPSTSRGAYLGIAAGLFTLGIAYYPSLLLTVPPILLGLWVLGQRVGWATIMEALSSGAVRSWAVRQELWSRAIYMMQDFPFTGIGPGAFRRVAPVLYPFFLCSNDSPPVHAHNLFLQVGVDLGVPGLVAYGAVIPVVILMAWRSFRRFRTLGQEDLAALSVGLLAAIVAMLAHGLLDAPLWGGKLAVVPWFIMGLIANLYLQTKKEEQSSPDPGSLHQLSNLLLAFGYWVLFSLLAIAFIGNRPYLGLAIALAGGVILGFSCVVPFERKVQTRKRRMEQLG